LTIDDISIENPREIGPRVREIRPTRKIAIKKLWRHCFPAVGKNPKKSEPGRPVDQSCKASSLVSRCKKALFGTRSPLPAPLSTHTYRVRVIRAKKFWICAPKALTNHQRTKSQSHGTAFRAHGNTLEASLNVFIHLPSLQFLSLYQLSMFYKQAGSTANPLAVVNPVRKFPWKKNLLRDPEEYSSGRKPLH
jgi:hypothetical protein